MFDISDGAAILGEIRPVAGIMPAQKSTLPEGSFSLKESTKPILSLRFLRPLRTNLFTLFGSEDAEYAEKSQFGNHAT